MSKKIFTNSFLSNVLKVASASIIAQVIGFFLLPIISRWYLPEHFGEFALYISIFSFISPLVALKYNSVIVIQKIKSEKQALYVISLASTTFLSIIFLIFLYFTLDYLIFFNITFNKNLLFLIPLLFFIVGFNQSTNFLFVSNNKFGIVSKIIIIEKISNLTARLSLGYFIPSGFTLIISEYINKTTVFIYSLIMIFKHKLYDFSIKGKRKFYYQLIKKYKKFPIYELPSDWLASISDSLPVLLIAYYFDDTQLGYYAFSIVVVRSLINLLSKSIGVVFFKKISDISQQDRSDFSKKCIDFLCSISILPFLLLAVGGEEFFSVLFGSDWVQSGIYTQILIPYLFMLLLVKSMGSLYRVYEKQGSLLYFNILNNILFCGSVFIGGTVNNMILTMLLISFSGIVIYGLIYFWILKFIQINFFDVFKIFSNHFLLALLFLSIPLLIKIFNNNDIIFVLFSTICLIFYVIYIYPKIIKSQLFLD